MANEKTDPRLQGRRKLNAFFALCAFLLLGFIFAVLCKASPELFTGYVGGLAAAQGFFTYGNAKEHEHKSKSQQPQTTPEP
jgi:hypothetical protein